MSFFGFGEQGQDQTGPSPIEVAKVEIRAQSEFFQKLTWVCKSKCVTKYLEGDLNVGEMSCVDRCASKFMEASSLIQKQTQENAEQAQKLVDSQNAILGGTQ